MTSIGVFTMYCILYTIQYMLQKQTKGEYLQVRLDSETKEKVEKVLTGLGLSMTEAVRMYLRQIIMKRAIPFEINLIEELSNEDVESVGKGLKDIEKGKYVVVSTKEELKRYFGKLNENV